MDRIKRSLETVANENNSWVLHGTYIICRHKCSSKFNVEIIYSIFAMISGLTE